jgi:hypothetical protein
VVDEVLLACQKLVVAETTLRRGAWRFVPLSKLRSAALGRSQEIVKRIAAVVVAPMCQAAGVEKVFPLQDSNRQLVGSQSAFVFTRPGGGYVSLLPLALAQTPPMDAFRPKLVVRRSRVPKGTQRMDIVRKPKVVAHPLGSSVQFVAAADKSKFVDVRWAQLLHNSDVMRFGTVLESSRGTYAAGWHRWCNFTRMMQTNEFMTVQPPRYALAAALFVPGIGGGGLHDGVTLV